MRFNLGNPVAEQRAAAIKRVTELARAAHAAHEDAGGYSLGHLQFCPEEMPEIVASRTRHLQIQARRQAAIARLRDAPHGAAIAEILEKYSADLEIP